MKVRRICFFILFVVICYSSFVYAGGGKGGGGGKQTKGKVTFRISHGHRRWIWGTAKHYAPGAGWPEKETFHHWHGYEYAKFGSQPTGASRGSAQITGGGCSCYDSKSYRVVSGDNIIDFALHP